MQSLNKVGLTAQEAADLEHVARMYVHKVMLAAAEARLKGQEKVAEAHDGEIKRFKALLRKLRRASA